MSKYKMGIWVAGFFILISLVYIILVLLAIPNGGLPPKEPFSRILNIVLFFSIPIMLLLWVIIHECTPSDKKVFSMGSLVLVTVLCTLTSINRYNAMTVVPQAQRLGVTDGLRWFMPYGWPSIMAAIETQAYGFYLSIALVVLSFVFRNGTLERSIFWTMNICGLLSFMSVLGQLFENNSLYMIGIIAWGPGLFLIAVLWLIWFRHKAKV